METGNLMSDDRLLERLRAGDEQAFSQVVSEWSPMLLRLAMAHTPSRAVAEEVVQDTWVAVLGGTDRFECRSLLRTWAISILLNTARPKGERERRVLPFALLRRREEEVRVEPSVRPDRFQGRRGESPGAWARPPAEWASPEETLASDAARTLMLEAIAALPPRQ